MTTQFNNNLRCRDLSFSHHYNCQSLLLDLNHSQRRHFKKGFDRQRSNAWKTLLHRQPSPATWARFSVAHLIISSNYFVWYSQAAVSGWGKAAPSGSGSGANL